MKPIIYDVFTDASIDKNTGLACAGFAIVDRETDANDYQSYILDPNSTNNRAEIMAIEQAVRHMVSMFVHDRLYPCEINLISDSLISVNGVREWMIGWKEQPDGTLINASGQVAANQYFYKEIFNLITTYGIKIKFWHQKGHVSETSPKSLFESEKLFYNSNGVSMQNAGYRAKYLAKYNNLVDDTSRKIIHEYQAGRINIDHHPFIKFYIETPMEFNRGRDHITAYQTLLKGGINYPLHKAVN